MTMTMMMMLFFAFYLYVFLLWYICCNIYAIEIQRLDLVSVYGVIKYRDNKKGINGRTESMNGMTLVVEDLNSVQEFITV